jgi:glyoxylase-like metal-dependent hydrolase (beta-lactamase superfamily II)
VDVVVDGLYASAPQAMPFGPSLEGRAFLLQRERGNLLIYSAGTLEPDARAIEELGGISRQYLNHRHEAAPSCDWVRATFDAPLHCHENERASVAETCAVDETFSERRALDDDFEVIPTPGHTSGATAYLWSSDHHRCLFTGDTIMLRAGEWGVVLLEGTSDRSDYLESLELICGLDFDLLAPGFATSGLPCYAVTDKTDRERRIDELRERVRGGENL